MVLMIMRLVMNMLMREMDGDAAPGSAIPEYKSINW